MRRFVHGTFTALLFACPMLAGLPLRAQGSQPVGITAAPPSPTGARSGVSSRARSRRAATASAAAPSARADAGTQTASEDHPLLPVATLGNALHIPSGTPIQVRLAGDLDSAHAKNGDTVQGALAEPLGGMPAGTPVVLTVISASAAGKMQSFGELSIQVLSVGGHPLLSNMINTQGQEGHKDIPDSAPAKGTEAIFSAAQPLTLPAA